MEQARSIHGPGHAVFGEGCGHGRVRVHHTVRHEAHNDTGHQDVEASTNEECQSYTQGKVTLRILHLRKRHQKLNYETFTSSREESTKN